jgi:rod shape determining protein RodA
MFKTITRKLVRLDWITFCIVMLLCAASIAIIYSATYTCDSAEFRDAFRAQMYWIPIGLVAFFFMALVDYSFWLRLAVPIYGLVFVMLIVVLFMRPINGATHWLRFGPISLQPAELCKISYIFLAAAILLHREKEVQSFWTFALTLVVALVPMALILKQPDLGSAAVFLPISFVMMFVAGVRLRYILVPTFLGLVIVAIAYFGVFQRGWKIPGLREYQLNRIKTFFNPNLDPKNAGWTINQSLLAIGSGGLTGKGWCMGTQNVLGYLPKNIAYNDFIFSVIGEEEGFVGGATLIILEGVILLSCLRVAATARDQTGVLIVCGVTAMLFTHIFVNIGMTIQVVPITGIPLPFISYGGTFLVICLTGMGLVQSVWIHRRSY